MHRTALDAAGIPNFADDHFMISINWLNANAVGGIKLRVPREELERARAVLEGAEDIGAPENVNDDAEPLESCPYCGSASIEPTSKWPIFAGIAILSLGVAKLLEQPFALLIAVVAFIATLMAPRRRCTECGGRW